MDGLVSFILLFQDYTQSAMKSGLVGVKSNCLI